VVVLRLGRRVATFVSRDVSPERIIRAITGAQHDISGNESLDV
jgi:hypothetical protein